MNAQTREKLLVINAEVFRTAERIGEISKTIPDDLNLKLTGSLKVASDILIESTIEISDLIPSSKIDL